MTSSWVAPFLPDLEFTKTNNGENEPCGLTMSHASSKPIEWSEVGGTTETLLGPRGHRFTVFGRHCVWTVARHHKHLQSYSMLVHKNFNIFIKLWALWRCTCNLSTDPHVLSQFKHFAWISRFPSIHWWGIIRLPSMSSIISLPTLANVVHLQFDIAFAAHRLCTLNLHTSQEKPWDVTPERASRHTFEQELKVEHFKTIKKSWA